MPNGITVVLLFILLSTYITEYFILVATHLIKIRFAKTQDQEGDPRNIFVRAPSLYTPQDPCEATPEG